jgi:protein AbiQ
VKIYEVEKAYIEYLLTVDETVHKEKDHPGAKTTKYLGVVLEINECKYFAPLTSPKPKHTRMKNDKDFMKIQGGRLGSINFNNMIPVPPEALISYDLSAEPDESYKNILSAQARFIRKNKEDVISTAEVLHEIMTGDKEEDASERERLSNRCCKFKLLEAASKEYGKPKVVER